MDHLALLHTVQTSIENPIGGIVPDFTIFGAEFTALWQKLIAGAWALGIIIAIVYLGVGILEMGKASQSGNAMEHQIGRTKALWAAIALGGLAALAVIVGSILAIFS